MAVSLIATTGVHVTAADTVRFNGREYRLYDIDAPQGGEAAQCHREAARAADTQAFVANLVAHAQSVQITPGYDPRDERSWPNDRAGKRLAYINIDGRDLGELLIEEGRAAPWNNREPHNWCSARG